MVATLAFGIAGLAVGAILFALVATQLLDYHMLEVRSESMQPVLATGDLIVTRPMAATDIEVGDIAVFTQGMDTPVLIAHRVVATIDGTINIGSSVTGENSQIHVRHLQTKGDANTDIDHHLVAPDQVQGAVWFRIPAVGQYVGNGAQQMLLILAGLSLVAWAAYELFRWSDRRQDRKELTASYSTPEREG